jgi:hypothetical protein
MRHVLSFFTSTIKNIVIFLETAQTHIDCRDVNANVLFNFINN